MKKIIAFIGFFIFMAAPVYCADYYCDFEGSNGSGTQVSPFNSIANAMSSMSGGDNLYCRGTATSAQTVSKGVNIYGNDAAWLAYGGGNNQATVNNSSSFGVKLTEAADNAILDGFIISNPRTHGIDCYASGAEIRNNDISDCGHVGIYIQDNGQDCTNVSIHDNIIDTTGDVSPDDGYGILHVNNNSAYDVGNITIYRNIFKNIGEEAIRFTGENATAYSNYFYKWGLTSPGDNAIQMHVNSWMSLSNCYVYNNIINGAGTTHGCGISLWIVSGGSISEMYVQNNSIYGTVEYGSEGYGIKNMGLWPTYWYVKNNIVYECADESASGSIGAIRMYWDYEDRVYFHNNIIYNTGYTKIISIFGCPSGQWHSVSSAEGVLSNASNNAQVQPGWVDTTPEDDVNDFKLSSSTANGAAGSSYPGENLYHRFRDDFYGNERQSSGNWDMGAIRVGGDAIPPNPPNGVHIK